MVLIAPVLGLIASGVGFGSTCYDLGEFDGHTIMPRAEVPMVVANLEKNSRWLATNKQRIKDQLAGRIEPNLSVIVDIFRTTDGEIVPEVKTATSMEEARGFVRESASRLDSDLRVVEVSHNWAISVVSGVKAAELKPGWRHGFSIILSAVRSQPYILIIALGVNLLGTLIRRMWRSRLLPRRRYAN